MTIKVFASGQSNMLGRGTGGPAFSGVSANVSVWNNVNPLGANGTAFVTASAAQSAGTFEFTDRNNLAVWLCDKLARTQFDTVTLAMVALGGASISMWDPAEVTFPLLNECNAVWDATGQGAADVFLWHQGEADTATADATYIAAFEALLVNLIAGGVISASTIILVGGVAEASAAYNSVNRDKLQKIAKLKGRGFASSSGLLTTDGSHFDGAGLYSMGARRYFSAWRFAKSTL